MTDAVERRAATAWGTSEWSAQQITEAFLDCPNSPGSEPQIYEQPQCSMLKRDRFETEYHPLYPARLQYRHHHLEPAGFRVSPVNTTMAFQKARALRNRAMASW